MKQSKLEFTERRINQIRNLATIIRIEETATRVKLPQIYRQVIFGDDKTDALTNIAHFLESMKLLGKNVYVSLIIFEQEFKFYSQLDNEFSMRMIVNEFAKTGVNPMGNMTPGKLDVFSDYLSIKESAKKVPTKETIGECIETLNKARQKGNNVFMEFNGACGKVKLYSLFDDEDSCCRFATGYTKKELDNLSVVEDFSQPQ